MRIVWGCLLAVALAFGAHPPRSACTKQTRGRLWPEQANADRSTAMEMMRSGEVFVCTYGRLWYRWEPLSVSLQALEAEHPRSKCDATPKTGQAEACPTASAAQ
jgi:hypothetical protein